MAEHNASEKTEQPTARKLRKAEEKGQSPQSQEMASVMTIIALIISVTLFGPTMFRWFQSELKSAITLDNSIFIDPDTFMSFVDQKIIGSMLIMVPVFIAVFAAVIFSGVIAGGLKFSPKAIELKFNQINPVEGFQKLVNGRSIVRLIISISKLAFISLIVWFYLQSRLETLASLRWAWTDQIVAITAKFILGLLIRIGIGLLVIGLADVLYQKWKYIQELKMTKQEVKQEHKETDGSPQVKNRIRKAQFDMAFKRTLQEVPKATVVIVNPTHVAVAIRYDAKTMDAPVVVSKGADHLAEKIREIARAYGVPIVQKPELARTIYATVKPGEPIPDSLYVAVAQVLAMIYRLRNKNKQN